MTGQVIHDMPFDEYLQIDAVSASLLKTIRASSQKDAACPVAETDAMRLGTAIHTAFLEPRRYKEDYRIAPKIDRRTKAGKQEHEAFLNASAGKIVITAEQASLVNNCVEALRENEVSKVLFADGHPEVTLLWTDEQTGLPCKARADWVSKSHNIILDLKSIRTALDDFILRESGKRGYHLQESHYIEGALSCGLGLRNMLFCFVTTAGRVSVHWHYFDTETRRKARIIREQIMSNLSLIWSHPKSNWPGYLAETEPQPISLSDYQL